MRKSIVNLEKKIIATARKLQFAPTLRDYDRIFNFLLTQEEKHRRYTGQYYFISGGYNGRQ